MRKFPLVHRTGLAGRVTDFEYFDIDKRVDVRRQKPNAEVCALPLIK